MSPLTRPWSGAGFTATGLLALTAGAGLVAVPFTVQQVLDRVHRPGSDFVLVAVGGGAAVLLVATVCAQVVEQRLVRRTEVLLHAVRTQAFQSLAERPGGSAEIRAADTRRTVDDLDRAGHVFRWTAPGLLLNLGRLVAVAVATALFAWQLALLVLAGAAVALGVQVLWWRRSPAVYRAVRRREVEVHSAIVRLVLHARQVRAYEDRRHEQARAERAVGERSRQRIRLARHEAGTIAVGELGLGAVVAVLIVAGAHLGAQREVTIGELGAVLTAFLLATPAMQSVVHAVRDGLDARVRWRRIRRTYLSDPVRTTAGD